MDYTTDNIAISAALKLLGHEIIHIEVEVKRASFVFNETAKDDAQKILLGKISVEPISFHQEVRRLSAIARSMSNRNTYG